MKRREPIHAQTPLEKIEHEIEQTLLRINMNVGRLMDLHARLTRHTKNRIAAHKAHHTMKKRQLGKIIGTVPFGGVVRITPAGERALRESLRGKSAKLKVVKLKGI